MRLPDKPEGYYVTMLRNHIKDPYFLLEMELIAKLYLAQNRILSLMKTLIKKLLMAERHLAQFWIMEQVQVPMAFRDYSKEITYELSTMDYKRKTLLDYVNEFKESLMNERATIVNRHERLQV